jgi:hypothetical protein
MAESFFCTLKLRIIQVFFKASGVWFYHEAMTTSSSHLVATLLALNPGFGPFFAIKCQDSFLLGGGFNDSERNTSGTSR